MKKISGFEWPRTAQMALRFLFVFSRIFKNIFRAFLVHQIIYSYLFRFTRVFFINFQKIKIGSFKRKPCIS